MPDIDKTQNTTNETQDVSSSKQTNTGDPKIQQEGNTEETSKEKIAKIKEKNQKEKIESECKKEWQDALSKDIEDLDKLYGGIDKVKIDYESVYDQLLCDFESFKKYNESVKKEIEEGVEEGKRNGINNRMKAFRGNIVKLKNCIDWLQGPCILIDCSNVDELPEINIECPDPDNVGSNASGLFQAVLENSCSEKVDKNRQKEYDELVNYQKMIEARIKSLLDLQKLIGVEKDKFKRFYYLREIQLSLEEKIMKPEDLYVALIIAWDALLCSKKDLRKKEYIKCVIGKTIEARKTNLEDAKKLETDYSKKMIEIL